MQTTQWGFKSFRVLTVTTSEARIENMITAQKGIDDTFTDGTNTFTFAGDPKIDANLGKLGATLPTDGTLTWVSTKTLEAYDTQSGDLEAGTYAQEADGSFITHLYRQHDADGVQRALPLLERLNRMSVRTGTIWWFSGTFFGGSF